jgi:hypothetical protein
MAFLSLENQAGRSSNVTQQFLEDERGHAWSKAFYVADRGLKTCRPREYDDVERVRGCAVQLHARHGQQPRGGGRRRERDQRMAKDRAAGMSEHETYLGDGSRPRYTTIS